MRQFRAQRKPAMAARNIHYDMSDRTRAIGCGGIGAIHLLARKIDLIGLIDRQVQLLKAHKPYHESDHVLNIAYNVLAGGRCLEDIERLRNDEGYLDALGATRIPDPTTAGDFCRRFESPGQVDHLQDTLNLARLKVWKQQPAEFFEQATIDADGTIAPTDGCCKEGMDISYDGQWGYHPLVVSLANTREPLYLLNRSGNRPSHENAAGYLDKAIALALSAGFKSVRMRGDTDFSQTAHLDRWDALGNVTFLFGLDAHPNLKLQAEAMTVCRPHCWAPLQRPPRYEVATRERTRPADVKQQVIDERGFKHLRLSAEHVAEMEYQPGKCKKGYRLILCRKTIEVDVHQQTLWREYRYFFFITNDRAKSPAELVLEANGRCNQENLIEQLKNGVHAMKLPTGDLVSNWAYMVMASLAWSLKAWFGLMLPEAQGRGPAKRIRREQKRSLVTMEFRTFVSAIIQLPAQIVRSGRRILYRLLSYSPWQQPLLEGAAAWRTRCQR